MQSSDMNIASVSSSLKAKMNILAQSQPFSVSSLFTHKEHVSNLTRECIDDYWQWFHEENAKAIASTGSKCLCASAK